MSETAEVKVETTVQEEVKDLKAKVNGQAKSAMRVLKWPLFAAGWLMAALVAIEYYNYMNAPVTDKIMRVFGF
jgi:hypothetical protein